MQDSYETLNNIHCVICGIVNDPIPQGAKGSEIRRENAIPVEWTKRLKRQPSFGMDAIELEEMEFQGDSYVPMVFWRTSGLTHFEVKKEC